MTEISINKKPSGIFATAEGNDWISFCLWIRLESWAPRPAIP